LFTYLTILIPKVSMEIINNSFQKDKFYLFWEKLIKGSNF